MTPTDERLFAAIDATWPAAVRIAAGPWILREGQGGGKRVSAATLRRDWDADDIAAAESAMRLIGQAPLFMLRPGDATLDTALAARGYAMVDPTVIRLCPVRQLADRRIPLVTAFAIWEPLAIMREIWEAGGVTPARQRVMDRVAGPKTGIFGRTGDKPAGTGFAAIHDGIAFVHALEIVPEQRRKGLADWMMRAAAHWADAEGAEWLAVLCTRANTGANALYASLGMPIVGEYHYRLETAPESEDP